MERAGRSSGQWSRHEGGVVRRALGAGALVGVVAGVVAGAGIVTVAGPASAAVAGGDVLYLVTLAGPGVAGDPGDQPAASLRAQLTGEQQRVLDAVAAPEPVYRWTTALTGFAVRLSPAQAAGIAAQPGVALVEQSTTRRLAASAAGGLAGATTTMPGGRGRQEGGAGVVIGIVDSGISSTSPVFAGVPGLGPAPAGYTGTCDPGPGWGIEACTGKVAGARWFVDGFGADRVRSSSALSPLDDDGHGTQMASIAAGNADVTVRVRGQRIGRYAGLAPQARVAAYKACWSAPDPGDDGCSTADLVSAVDAATADGVDVLNLSVAGPATRPAASPVASPVASPAGDTLERALLGATEAGIVVVAAAGNDPATPAAHPSPWVTTVGGSTGVVRRGQVLLGRTGPRLTGAMSSVRGVGPTRLVVGADVAAAGSTPAAARICSPDSLDASRVRGSIVWCERGGIGRVDKSAAVRRADGVAMVLVNTTRGSVDSDFHSVPTVHVAQARGRVLSRWHAAHPDARLTLRPLGPDRTVPSVVGWSSRGDPAAAFLKPDVVAPARGALGAVPQGRRGVRWDFVSGTSAAAAYTSGAAAVLLADRGWSADVVRSALATTATRVRGRGDVLSSGAGRVRPAESADPGLVYRQPARDYRAWLEGTLEGDLNTPSLVLPQTGRSARTATRTITNLERRTRYFSSSATGFAAHRVTVTPAAVRLGPGESATYTVRVTGPGRVVDDGYVAWRGARGSLTRIPVLLTRGSSVVR